MFLEFEFQATGCATAWQSRPIGKLTNLDIQ